MAPADHFALAQARVSAVLEQAIRTDGLRGAPFVDAVVCAIRDGSPPVVAASGSLSSVDDKAEKKELLDPEEKSTLDLSMRIFLDALLTKAKASKLSAEAAGVVELLDCSIELAGADAADWNTPFALIEDLFDLQLISESESIFPLIERRADALAALMGGDPAATCPASSPAPVSPHAWAACTPCRRQATLLPQWHASSPPHPPAGSPASSQRAKLTFIRTCNELLRRLSKSINTNFCGRVLMLMAYMLPLSERSGVNLKGLHAPSHLLLQQIEAPGAPRSGEHTEGGPADSLYGSFWGLQSAFADPSAAMAADAWAVLVERLEAVLQGFSNIVSTEPSTADAPAHPTASAEGADTGGGGGREAVEEEAEAMGKEVYFAKFLTSPKLLQLQLRDSYFRRHVLVRAHATLPHPSPKPTDVLVSPPTHARPPNACWRVLRPLPGAKACLSLSEAQRAMPRFRLDATPSHPNQLCRPSLLPSLFFRSSSSSSSRRSPQNARARPRSPSPSARRATPSAYAPQNSSPEWRPTAPHSPPRSTVS
jgi:hypothetical protein